jgi:hypothetical protein
MSTDEDVAVRRGKVCTQKNDRVIFHLGQPQRYEIITKIALADENNAHASSFALACRRHAGV